MCRIFHRLRAIQTAHRGFTLLELLVVLVIIALASGLVAPRLIGSLSNTTLLTTGKQITASLRWARSMAVSQRIRIVSIFDIPNNRLIFKNSVLKDGGPDWDQGNGDTGGGQPLPVYDLPKNVTLEMGVTEGGKIVKEEFQILFYPVGNSSGGEIVVSNDRGRRIKITVDLITGSARLLEMPAG